MRTVKVIANIQRARFHPLYGIIPSSPIHKIHNLIRYVNMVSNSTRNI